MGRRSIRAERALRRYSRGGRCAGSRRWRLTCCPTIILRSPRPTCSCKSPHCAKPNPPRLEWRPNSIGLCATGCVPRAARWCGKARASHEIWHSPISERNFAVPVGIPSRARQACQKRLSGRRSSLRKPPPRRGGAEHGTVGRQRLDGELVSRIAGADEFATFAHVYRGRNAWAVV